MHWNSFDSDGPVYFWLIGFWIKKTCFSWSFWGFWSFFWRLQNKRIFFHLWIHWWAWYQDLNFSVKRFAFWLIWLHIFLWVSPWCYCTWNQMNRWCGLPEWGKRVIIFRVIQPECRIMMSVGKCWLQGWVLRWTGCNLFTWILGIEWFCWTWWCRSIWLMKWKISYFPALELCRRDKTRPGGIWEGHPKKFKFYRDCELRFRIACWDFNPCTFQSWWLLSMIYGTNTFASAVFFSVPGPFFDD